MTAASPQRSLSTRHSLVWSLLLFLALLRGLVPHTALAAIADDGSPQLRWCAPSPGSPAPSAADLAQALTAHASCVCASTGDTLAPPLRQPDLRLPAADLPRPAAATVSIPRGPAPDPRARGPPSAIA